MSKKISKAIGPVECKTDLAAPTVPFPRDEYVARIGRALEEMKKKKLDAIILINSINRQYLNGFASTNGFIVLHSRQPSAFFTDFRYLEMAKTQIDFMDVVKIKNFKGFCRIIGAKYKMKKVGYEGGMPSNQLQQLKKMLKPVRKWVDCGEMLLDLRSIKSKLEQEVMRKAARLNDAAFSNVISKIKDGMTEWHIRRLIRAEGDSTAQGEAFPCIVCVGANASKCHHKPSLDKVEHGKTILMDMGMMSNDYLTDMTRTVFRGPPSKELRKIYGIVLAANLKGISLVKPGAKCGDVDKAARKIIEDAGYGKYFGHGLGHGVGLEIHEEPRLAIKNRKILKPGMVITIEPGIYIPGVGGVRIEDLVLVTESGFEVLSKSRKTLTVI